MLHALDRNRDADREASSSHADAMLLQCPHDGEKNFTKTVLVVSLTMVSKVAEARTTTSREETATVTDARRQNSEKNNDVIRISILKFVPGFNEELQNPFMLFVSFLYFILFRPGVSTRARDLGRSGSPPQSP